MKRGKEYCFLFLCALLLTACGKQRVDYKEAENGSVQQEDESRGDDAKGEQEKESGLLSGALAQTVGAEAEWHAEWVVTVESAGRQREKKIKVDAKTVFPDTDAMQIIKVKPKTYSAEEKKKMAEQLFDEGSIRMVGNGGFETKEEVLVILENWKSDLEEVRQSKEDAYLQACMEEIEYYQRLYDNFSEITENDYSQDKFVGTVKGQPYILEFQGGYGPPNYGPGIRFAPDFETDVMLNGRVMEGYNYGRLVEEGSFGENQADMTREEAENTAKRWCDRLGIEGLSVGTVFDLNWASYLGTGEDFEPDKTECNGYIVVMQRKVKDCDVFSKHLTRACYGSLDDGDFNLQPEKLVFYLTDDGLLKMQYQCPLQEGEVMTERTELLGYSRIQNQLEELAKEVYAGDGTDTTEFLDTMELTYMCVRDSQDKDTYYLLPVWCLYEEDWFLNLPGGTFVDPLEDFFVDGMVVNAVDGSPIDLKTLSD